MARPVTVAALAAAVLATASLGTEHAPTARAAAGSICASPVRPGPLRPARSLRFGIDPELAGSAGSHQNPVAPVSAARTLRALRALRPPGRELVLRVNRLFESLGEPGIRRFERIVDGYARAGFDVELQVRYHPAVRQTGNIAAWTRYVRHVVDAFGPDPHVVAMTITNEINVAVSPNTSDGAYPRAEQALIRGIIAAHREAERRGFHRLRFGFTYAYCLRSATDAEMFRGLRAGGAAFRRALGFVGVDFYPELYPELYPGRATPLPAATTAMLTRVRRRFMGLAGLGARVPIWITENGYDTTPGRVSGRRQRAALTQMVQTIRRAARTFHVTDYRWFNLRDNLSSSPAFGETSGLLTAGYRRKPAFGAYRALIARFGARRPTAGRHSTSS